MSICAVIVSYQPSEELIENVGALLDQVDEIVIVDNGSGTSTKEMLGKLNSLAKVSVLYNEENLGIAAALNIGVKHARAKGHEWVATFDQDSQATVGMIEAMLHAYDSYPQKEKIASLSSRYLDKNSGRIGGSRLISSSSGALPYAEAQVVLTSGNLVKSSIFDSVGYFNEALFIDYVDIEFCLRCANRGYKILEAKDAVLVHSIGFPVQHKILWKKLMTSNHSALRRYYIARNAIYLYKEFFITQPGWVIRNMISLVDLVVVLAICETNRKKKLIAILKGVIDGLFGRMGRSPIEREAF